MLAFNKLDEDLKARFYKEINKYKNEYNLNIEEEKVLYDKYLIFCEKNKDLLDDDSISFNIDIEGFNMMSPNETEFTRLLNEFLINEINNMNKE